MTGAKRFINRGLAKLGYQFQQTHRHLWDDDARFVQLVTEIEHRTLVDRVRCFMLYQFACHAAHLTGQAAEVGVYKGGTARLLAEALASSTKTLHLFDTFAGMPETDAVRDLHKTGDFGDTSLEGVREFLRNYPNVEFHPGLFPATAGPVNDQSFCLVHADVDIYSSILDCCEFFFPRLVPGGILVFDDYGSLTCPGAKLAVDEFFAVHDVKPYYLPTGQAFAIK